MNVNLIGEKMDVNKLKILGAGLSCIDIIKQRNQKDQFFMGGTAANVISALALMGINCSFIQPNYLGKDGRWLKNAMGKRNIAVINCCDTSCDAPRIAEELENGRHCFKTICPVCGKNMLSLKLPQTNHVKKIASSFDEINLFYFDRISSGIKWIEENNKKGWNCYEPNSFRNYKVLVTNAKEADILKVSNERCSDENIEKLKNDLSDGKTKLLIISLGGEGVKYSYKNANGQMSDWIYIKSQDGRLVFDSAGAGDWMTAAFLYEFIKTYPYRTARIDKKVLDICMHKAEKIASFTCSYLGAQGVMENKEALDYIGRLLGCEMESTYIKYEVDIKRCIYCYK